MNKVELRFVPLWVQRAMVASGYSLSDALDESKVSRILSPRDLEKYYMSQRIFHDAFFFKMVCGTFETHFKDNVYSPLSNELLADMVYGHIPMGDDRSSTPAFTSTVYGLTDTIIVSVVTGQEAEQFSKHMFMKRLIEQMIGLRSLEHVAPLPLFKEWIQGIDTNKC